MRIYFLDGSEKKILRGITKNIEFVESWKQKAKG